MTTIRLTAAQAMVRFLSVQMTEEGERFIEGSGRSSDMATWRDLAKLSKVLAMHFRRGEARTSRPWRTPRLPTPRQRSVGVPMPSHRRSVLALLTWSPQLHFAHVNRLPVLFIPGDVFANRRPDPVLQQVEDFEDGSLSANDCLRPVSKYFDRIHRPEQLLTALPRAIRVMTDPANCGPVTLAFCQDVRRGL